MTTGECGRFRVAKSPSDREAAAFVFDPDSPPTPACHAPTIAALPDRLVAAWFAGSHEKNPDVGIWCAINRNDRWETPRQVADGWGEACWNPVLCNTAAGLHLFYKVGVSPARWRGAVLTSTDGGETWRDRGELPAPWLGPVKNKPLALANGDLLCPSSREAGGWRCHFETFSPDLERLAESAVPDPGDLKAIQPAAYKRGDTFEALARTKSGCIGLTRSPDGRRWSALERTELPNPNSGIDAVNLPDGRALLVYNPATTPEGRWGGARTPIALALSGNDGAWRDVMTLDDDASEPDGGAPEFSYPAVICDEAIHVVYTWHRRTIKHVRVTADEL